MSGVQTVKNTKNPFGVPFVDEAGNEITGMVKQQPGDSQSGELPGFEGSTAFRRRPSTGRRSLPR